jgi:uncharacterized membrane protein
MKIDLDKKRHILKTISWRILGTADTILLAWIITGDIKTGASIGIIELFSKMLLYYMHERFWFKYIRMENKTVNEK